MCHGMVIFFGKGGLLSEGMRGFALDYFEKSDSLRDDLYPIHLIWLLNVAEVYPTIVDEVLNIIFNNILLTMIHTLSCSKKWAAKRHHHGDRIVFHRHFPSFSPSLPFVDGHWWVIHPCSAAPGITWGQGIGATGITCSILLTLGPTSNDPWNEGNQPSRFIDWAMFKPCCSMIGDYTWLYYPVFYVFFEYSNRGSPIVVCFFPLPKGGW